MNYTKLSRITLNYSLRDKYVLWYFPEQDELKHELKIMSEHLPHARCKQLGRSALKLRPPQYRQLPSAHQLQNASHAAGSANIN